MSCPSISTERVRRLGDVNVADGSMDDFVNVSTMLFVTMGSLSVYGLLLVRSKRAKASCFVLERSYRYLTQLLHSSSAQGVWILGGGHGLIGHGDVTMERCKFILLKQCMP
jgi:hypothetical protein